MQLSRIHYVVEGLKRLEKAHEKILEKNPDRVRDWKRSNRQKLLDERVPDRRCPLCEEVLTKSRSWVLLKNHVRWLPVKARRAGAVCRRCWFKEKRK